MCTHPELASMTNPDLTNALLGLTTEIACLTGEVGRLAAAQVSPASISRLEAGQVSLQADVAELKAGQASLQADVAELKADMVTVKADVAELKADMVTVKADVSDLKAGQAELRSDVLKLQVGLESQSHQLRLVAEGHAVLLAEIARLSTDTEAGFREARDFMIFIHRDLCERMDSRFGDAGAPARS